MLSAGSGRRPLQGSSLRCAGQRSARRLRSPSRLLQFIAVRVVSGDKFGQDAVDGIVIDGPTSELTLHLLEVATVLASPGFVGLSEDHFLGRQAPAETDAIPVVLISQPVARVHPAESGLDSDVDEDPVDSLIA